MAICSKNCDALTVFCQKMAARPQRWKKNCFWLWSHQKAYLIIFIFFIRPALYLQATTAGLPILFIINEKYPTLKGDYYFVTLVGALLLWVIRWLGAVLLSY